MNFIETLYRTPNYEALSEFVNYLREISEKPLSNQYLCEWIYKTSVNKRDKRIFSRCHSQAAANYLAYINDNEFIEENERLRYLIADIKPFVDELDGSRLLEFIVFSTNTIPSTIHYSHAKELFYNPILGTKESVDTEKDILTLYALRLSLEKRIKGILGIKHLRVKQRELGLTGLLAICKSLKTIEYNTAVDWSALESINKWINYHVHLQIRPFNWAIHTAFELLHPLLEPGEWQEGHRRIHSFYSSCVVRSEKEYVEELNDAISNIDNVNEVIFTKNRELLILGD